jgi:hypothetical protein
MQEVGMNALIPKNILLAKEQYAYCADIVEQGVGTIEALAATLLNGHIWFFWWD